LKFASLFLLSVACVPTLPPQNVRIFLEAGLVVGAAQYSSPTFSGDSSVLVGPYAAAGVELIVR